MFSPPCISRLNRVFPAERSSSSGASAIVFPSWPLGFSARRAFSLEWPASPQASIGEQGYAVDLLTANDWRSRRLMVSPFSGEFAAAGLERRRLPLEGAD